MTLAFVIYALAIGGLLSAAALAVERALRALHLPRRAPWVVALVVTTLLPALVPLRSETAPVAPTSGWRVVSPSEGAPTEGPGLMELSAASVRSVLQAPRPWLPSAMLGLTLFSSLLLVGGMLRLRRGVARWPRAEVGNEEVRVTDGFGPAVIGWLRPRIALPHSALRLSPAELAMVLRHEAEHRRAGDPVLLVAGAALLCVNPWNAFLWLQLRQLRRAVEMDCDERVLESGVSPARYGRLLLQMQAGDSALQTLAPNLTGGEGFLERRLMTMKTRYDSRRPGRAVALTGAAAFLTVLACDTPTPTMVADAPEEKEYEEVITAESVPGTFTLVDGSLHDVTEIPVEGVAASAIYKFRVLTGEELNEFELQPETVGNLRLDESELPLRLHYRVSPVASGADDFEVESVAFELRDDAVAPAGVATFVGEVVELVEDESNGPVVTGTLTRRR